MTVIDSRVVKGKLTFTLEAGTPTPIDVSCQVTAIVVKATVNKGTIQPVLCGDSTDSGGDITYTLDVSVIQDFDSADGFTWWALDNAGSLADFVWTPNDKATVTGMSGTVLVAPIDIGGAVATQAISQFSWMLTGKPTKVPPTPAELKAPSAKAA